MLELLRIRDLALIDDLELEFASGLNVLTGETGAGKSFIMRALDFLTGERMSPDLVRPGREKAQVEALFVLEGEDLAIRRELSAETGRSRIFINGSIGSQDAVREMAPRLILHTSQHKQQKLLEPSFQAKILDSLLPDPEVLAGRGRLLGQLGEVADRTREITQLRDSLAEKRDFFQYQLDAISQVDPKPGEEDALTRRKEEIRDLERARAGMDKALEIIRSEGGLADLAAGLNKALAAVAATDQDFIQDAEAVEGFYHLAGDIADRLASARRDHDQDMSLDDIEARLYELSRLKRKLGRGLDEIMGLRDEITDNLSRLDSSALDLADLKKREQALKKELAGVLKRLDKDRAECAETLCAGLEKELAGLGFPAQVRVRYDFTPHEPYPGLSENKGRLIWIPNPGQAPQPLEKIASGGELSRFLLALTSLVSRDSLPTLIFDEVDAGIGGLTLNAVGERMTDLAANRQILLITHWPQLAGLARRHFLVSKHVADDQTSTTCAPLGGEAVLNELSRMAGGGDKGRALAEKLVEKG